MWWFIYSDAGTGGGDSMLHAAHWRVIICCENNCYLWTLIQLSSTLPDATYVFRNQIIMANHPELSSQVKRNAPLNKYFISQPLELQKLLINY